ncbi:hypothetical protein K9M79_07685 [Candidatus Woesearchaeota archaeon]|nr:hypothetical protein [Candidatus Woesearchaeota archaeon]
MSVVYIPFALIAIFGIITSYSDYKKGKVSNKVISIFFIIGTVISISYGVWTATLIYTLVNILIAILVGFAFYYANLLAPGDGKLFTVYATLIPAGLYETTITFFPAVFIGMYAFCVAFLYLGYKVIKDFEFDKTATSLFNFKNLGFLALAFFSMEYVTLYGMYLGMHQVVIRILILAAISWLYQLKNKLIWVFGGLAVVRLIFDRSLFSTTWFIQYSISVLVFHVISAIFIKSGKFRKHKNKQDLKVGDVLAEDVGKNKEGSVLDHKIIGKIKKETKIKKIFIAETMPFAMSMFLGALIALFFRGWIF